MNSDSNASTAPVLKTVGAPAFYLAIFLNATIDLGHKITLQNTVFKVHDGAQQIILIAIINALILLPYILLVVPVGRVANRTAKPVMIRVTAWCSLALTIVISGFYWQGWFWPAFAMTLLMAVQSAFYSPAKLSYLKVFFGEQRLAQSNGLAQAIVIGGILLGTLIFSLGFEFLYTSAAASKQAVTALMPPLGAALVALALVQLIAAYRIPVVPEQLGAAANNGAAANGTAANNGAAANGTAANNGAAANNTEMQPELSPPRTLGVLRDRNILLPVLILALFWSVGQGMLAAFPAFAKAHAGIENAALIQGILSASAIGIAVGAFIAGRVSQGRIRLSLVPLGVVGLSAGLWSLTLLHDAWAFAMAYFSMGVASALLIVPMNAFIQLNAEGDRIGGVIAASNFFQNIAMLIMLVTTILFALANFDSAHLLQMMALLTTVLGGYLAWQIMRFSHSAG